MKVITILSGTLQENTYLIYNEGKNDAVLIDPGDDADEIISVLEEKRLNPTHIFLTHGHFDHIGAVNKIYKKYSPKIAINKYDAKMLTDKECHTIPFIQINLCDKGADILLNDGQVEHAADIDFKILHTPGHTPGSICIIAEDSIFTGDTLFAGSIGRTDFKEGNSASMEQSLKLLKNLPGNYKVYPGHGSSTTLDRERLYNPFLAMLN